MATKADDFALFVAVLAEAFGARMSPRQVADEALWLRKMARKLERFAVKHCNVGLSEQDSRAEMRAIASLKLWAEREGVQVRTGGDPRGYCLKLVLPAGRYNTMGGAEEGWGVPT